MSHRVAVTYICDECGRMSSHEQLSSGFTETIYTNHTYPKDWWQKKREGGGEITPRLDYCPTCKPTSMRAE